MTLSALLDASVLHPMALCDLLVRLALEDLYRPLRSREILDETARSLIRRLENRDVERLRRRVRGSPQYAALRKRGRQLTDR